MKYKITYYDEELGSYLLNNKENNFRDLEYWDLVNIIGELEEEIKNPNDKELENKRNNFFNSLRKDYNGVN